MRYADNIAFYFGFFLLLVNCVLFLVAYNKKRPKTYKLFTGYLLVSFVITISSEILAQNGMNNLFLSHVYFISQFYILSLFYAELLEKIHARVINVILGLVTLMLIIQYALDTTLFYRFNLFEVFITSFPLVVYSTIHLYNALNDKMSYMYVNGAILMYLSTSTLIFILGNYISSIDKALALNIYLIHKILYIIFLILILTEWKVSIWKMKDISSKH